MKIIILIAMVLLLAPAQIFGAECSIVRSINETGPVLLEFVVGRIPDEAVTELVITARADGTSWRKKGSEAAILSVFVDERYQFDLILFAGSRTFTYRSSVSVDPGSNIKIVYNRSQSPSSTGVVKIVRASVQPRKFSETDRSSIRRTAFENAPMIYARPDTVGRFSDIPLLTYFEIFSDADGSKRIRYSVIYSNEDGGTNSQALLARWGRLTDIEWIYEMKIDRDGRVESEIFQAANHETKGFRGKRFGSRPLFLDATVNNNFADEGCSELRFSPLLVEADLSSGSRETVMDAHPWTYEIMADEAVREGRVNPRSLGPSIVDDPRNYFLIEVRTQLSNAAISIRIDGPGGSSESDLGLPFLRMDRNGYARIAVRKPISLKTKWPKLVTVLCHAKGASTGSCTEVEVLEILSLDNNYRLNRIRHKSLRRSILAGEKADFTIAASAQPLDAPRTSSISTS